MQHALRSLPPAWLAGLVDDVLACAQSGMVKQCCGVAMPLHADDEGNYSVMDGKQRLASLITFYIGDTSLGGLDWPEYVAQLRELGAY